MRTAAARNAPSLNLRSWRPPLTPIGPTNSAVFVPYLRDTAALLTTLEETEWRSDLRSTSQWSAMVLQARSRGVPLIQITEDLLLRISMSAAEPASISSATSAALHLLQSVALHRELGFSSPLSSPDTVTLAQLVPVLQLPDGYLDAQVQEALISAFMPRLELDWLMRVIDAYRENPPAAPASPVSLVREAAGRAGHPGGVGGPPPPPCTCG